MANENMPEIQMTAEHGCTKNWLCNWLQSSSHNDHDWAQQLCQAQSVFQKHMSKNVKNRLL